MSPELQMNSPLQSQAQEWEYFQKEANFFNILKWQNDHREIWQFYFILNYLCMV